MKKQQTTLDQIGGDAAVSELIDQFYYKVLFDQNLRMKFVKCDMTRVRHQQKIYFCKILGSKTDFKGRLRDLQKINPIRDIFQSHHQFDIFLEHMHLILNDMEFSEDIINLVKMEMEKERQNVVYQGKQE